ncbi:hypothetical protein [Gaopeijia maritima]|uniref:Tryptophan-rich sensory protein n=1 Tax=Gaopeijia maritima TaxID=3119007 RepID=A0ABU9E6B1_9BACT
MNTRSWSIVHLVLTIALVVWSGLTNSGLVFEQSVGEISDQTRNAFTPASWAFAIWGLIYAALIVMGLFGVRRAFGSARSDAFVQQLGAPFAVAQLVCMAWLAAWLTGAFTLSMVLMTALLASLYLCVCRLDMERWDAPWPIIAFVWWPMSAYFGWITAAWLANLSAWLVALGSSLPTSAGWAIALAVVLTLVHLTLIHSRNMREASMVAVWALVAVGARHWDAPMESPVFLATTACAATLLIAAGAHARRNFTWPPREGAPSSF